MPLRVPSGFPYCLERADRKTVEIQLSRWNKTTLNDGTKGRWFTKRYLKDTEKIYGVSCLQVILYRVFALQFIFYILLSMFWPIYSTLDDLEANADKAQGPVCTNPVHGDEKSRLILEDFFENTNEHSELQHKVRHRWRTL